MASLNFSTENRNFLQLLGAGQQYRVPMFQRDYAWTETEWEELWYDIDEMLNPQDGGDAAHYMGYLVLQTRNARDYSVIDGQQRLTTLTLLVLAGLRILQKLPSVDDRTRLLEMQRIYIGSVDPVTLSVKSKLELNRNNDAYFRTELATLKEKAYQRNVPVSCQQLRKAVEWFEAKLNERIRTENDKGLAIAEFVDKVSNGLFFTVVTVSDELNAFKVFETLNARGVRLSSTDLLKNYLFSILAGSENEHQDDIEHLLERWESLAERLGEESFPDFLRMHWNSRNPLVRAAELYKTLRKHVVTRADVFRLLREMDEDIECYLNIRQPEGSEWPLPWREACEELRLFGVRQPTAMLLAAHRALSKEEFGSLLEAVVVIAFRCNVIAGRHSGESERIYGQAALRLQKCEGLRARDVLQTLEPLYVPDGRFVPDFSAKSVPTGPGANRNKKLVRYILGKLELLSFAQALDVDSKTYTIEHILPQNPEEGWDAFADTTPFVYRIGNMTLLEANLNRELKNAAFSQKLKAFSKSSVSYTRRIAEECETWTPETIEKRQRRMAQTAKTVWRISAYDN